MIMKLLRWCRGMWKPISKVGQSIQYTDVFLTFLSKADRVTHKNTKTFIQFWLENLSWKRSSLKPINYDSVLRLHICIFQEKSLYPKNLSATWLSTAKSFLKFQLFILRINMKSKIWPNWHWHSLAFVVDSCLCVRVLHREFQRSRHP